MDTDAKSDYRFVAYNRKDGKGFEEDFIKLAKEAKDYNRPILIIDYLNHQTYKEYTTEDWQKALDYRSERNALSRGRYNINQKTILAVWNKKGKLHFPIVITNEDAMYWSRFFKEEQDKEYMAKKYNRVEQRLINEIKNSEKVTENAEKSFEELMFGNTHFKSKRGFDEYGVYGENNPSVKSNNQVSSRNEARIHGDDPAINPKHYKMIPKEAYNKYPNGLEYMDLMEYILIRHKGVEGHLLGQIFKYACRLGRKDSIVQDAKKIEWYANRLVKVLKNA
jgi:hypothetical protein